MKTKLLGVLIFLSIFTTSCKEEKLVTVPIKDTDLKITLYENEAKLYDTYNKVIEDNNEICFGKKKKRVIYKEIEEKYFPNDVDFLAKALNDNDEIKKYTLKNGAFGVSYTTKPNKKGKTYKHYIFYLKKGDKYYKFRNNETFNYKMKYFDHIKNAIESLQ